LRSLRFQIRNIQGHVDLVNVESERATIGSGAHCEIRLGVDQARIEHVRIDLGPAGAFATALAFDPPPTLNGVPFTQMPLAPEAVVGVGQTQIQIQVVDSGDGASATAKATKTSPAALIGAVLAAGIGATFFVPTAGEEAGLSSPPQERLWPDTPKACAQAGAPATALAWEKVGQANSKRERRPFHVQDGVGAVPLFEFAAACFKAGGDSGNARTADATAAYLRADIARDYRKYHVRLEYHVRTENWTGAHADVLRLLEYTESIESPYRNWLVSAERRLKQRAARDPAAGS
jgi:hypothetical protein